MKSIKVVRVIGGKRQEMEIPVDRARELGISGPPPYTLSVAYLMDGLFIGTEGGNHDQTCSTCGTTVRDVLLQRRVGCPHCFDTFGPVISRILRFHHQKKQHTGRLPVRLQRYRNLFIEREELQQRLTLAVASENFEVAAEIRDRIDRLK